MGRGGLPATKVFTFFLHRAKLRADFNKKGAFFLMEYKYWNQLDIAALNDGLFYSLVDHSYNEVLKKLPKKIRIKYGLE